MRQQYGELSILITSYQIPDLLDNALQSIQPFVNSGAEVLVCDAGSDPQTLEVCSKYAVELWRTDNRGYSALINGGIQRTTRPFVLVLNGDAFVLNAPLDDGLRFLRLNPQVAVLGLRHVDVHDSFQLSFWPLSHSFGGELLRNVVTRGLLPHSAALRRLLEDCASPLSVKWVSGSAFLAPRRAFSACAWDEQFFLFYEDIDWCLRLGRLGYGIVYFPALSVVHQGGGSTGAIRGAMRDIYHASQARMYDKHGSFLSRLSIRGYQWMRNALSCT